MFTLAVALFMFVMPLGSSAIELVQHGSPYMFMPILGKWFVFWGIGVRLFTAGIRQMLKPGLTAQGILKINNTEAHFLVRELGAANAGIGLVAIVSLWRHDWLPPSALTGGIFLGIAGLLHCRNTHRNFEENLAMYSDLFVAVMAVTYLVASGLR